MPSEHAFGSRPSLERDLQATSLRSELTPGTTRKAGLHPTLTDMAKSGRPLTRPDLGKLRPHPVWVDDPTWNETLERAQAEGVSAGELVRRALREMLST